MSSCATSSTFAQRRSKQCTTMLCIKHAQSPIHFCVGKLNQPLGRIEIAFPLDKPLVCRRDRVHRSTEEARPRDRTLEDMVWKEETKENRDSHPDIKQDTMSEGGVPRGKRKTALNLDYH